MAKKGFDISGDVKKFTRHKQDLKRGMIRVSKAAAQQALDAINDGAPEDTGALKTAGYVIAREFNGQVTSGYERSIVEAAGKNMDIENRGQAQEELQAPAIPTGEPKAWAAVHIPLDYADILRDGFPHIKAKIDIPPNPFFDNGVEAADAKYAANAQKMVDEELTKLEQK